MATRKRVKRAYARTRSRAAKKARTIAVARKRFKRLRRAVVRRRGKKRKGGFLTRTNNAAQDSKRKFDMRVADRLGSTVRTSKPAPIDLRNPNFVPDRAYCSFYFLDGADMVCSSNDYSVSCYDIDPFDPYFHTGGRSPYGWKRISSLYKNYSVTRVEFEYTFYNPRTGEDAVPFEVFLQKTRAYGQLQANGGSSPYGCYMGEQMSSGSGQYQRDFSNTGPWHKHMVCLPGQRVKLRAVWTWADNNLMGDTGIGDDAYRASCSLGYKASGTATYNVMGGFYIGYRMMTSAIPGNNPRITWQIKSKMFTAFQIPVKSTANVEFDWPTWDGQVLYTGGDLDNAAYTRTLEQPGDYRSYQTNYMDDYNPNPGIDPP